MVSRRISSRRSPIASLLACSNEGFTAAPIYLNLGRSEAVADVLIGAGGSEHYEKDTAARLQKSAPPS